MKFFNNEYKEITLKYIKCNHVKLKEQEGDTNV